MVKRFVLVYCLSYLLTACTSNYINWHTNDNIRKIGLGMSKEQVIQVLGKNYMVSSSSKDERNNQIEVLAYKSDAHEEYRLKFINDKLTEWNREFTNKYLVKDPS
ncbi:hypothetical protein GCM10028825_51590 [Spirosoma agri]